MTRRGSARTTRTLALAALALLTIGTAGAGAAVPCPAGDARPWCDRTKTAEQRAKALTAALTPSEVMALLAGAAAGEHTGAIAGIPRLGVPTAYVTDGPVGVRQGFATALPTPMAEAATFDPQQARLHGVTIGEEARRKGNIGVLAPTVNIMRTPRGGRTFEGYGEDPYLAGRIAVAWIQGAQSRGVFATVKHFAANNQEGADPTGLLSSARLPIGFATDNMRYIQNSILTERTLHEIYLPAFEAAVKEGKVGSVMCSYNRVNGPWACASKHLLTDILGGWGFDGLLMSDWIFGTHAFDTANQLKAGLDLEMPAPVSYSPAVLQAILASGQATRTQVAARAERILQTLIRFGLLDQEPLGSSQQPIDSAAGDAAAQQIAEGGSVLLENHGILPLAPSVRSIAVIGPNARSFVTGGGSGSVKPTHRVSLADGIVARAGSNVKVAVDDGTDRARAVALAKGADVAVVAVGDYQTEGADKSCLTLECPFDRAGQDALVEAVAAAQPKTVVVLETGGPVLLPWRDRVAGLLEAWYPGQAGGTAIARILFGDVDPGGRLPSTFPVREADEPTAGARRKYPGTVSQDVHYDEGVLVGYRWWDAKRIAPAYPFGYGQSYTTWRYRRLKVAPGAGGTARVSLDVTNTGTRAGTDVAQLYVGIPDAGEAPRQLKGFRKVALAPGRTRRIAFTLDRRAVSVWGANGWRVPAGCVAVSVGRSSRDLPLRGVIAAGGRAACPAAKVAIG